MATAKKPTTKSPAKSAPAEEYRMPMEVKEWIDQAASRLKSLQGKIDRLEAEIVELKSYKRWAEHRILGSSHE
jgi:peptidoglycan hydrolase CwlO-like protein